MSVAEQAERVRLAAEEELVRSQRALRSVGLSWSEPELIVWKHAASEYTAELRVQFYHGKDLVDLFEFIVCDGGALTVSEVEVSQWIRDNVPDVVRRRTQS